MGNFIEFCFERLVEMGYTLISDILASPAQKMIPPPDIWGASFRKLTYGPTKLTRTKGYVNLVNMNDSSSCYHTMFIQRL